MWMGIAQLTLAFCSLLALLSWEAVSFVVPAMALSYVAGALGGKYLLGEQLTPGDGRESASCQWAWHWCAWVRRSAICY